MGQVRVCGGYGPSTKISNKNEIFLYTSSLVLNDLKLPYEVNHEKNNSSSRSDF